MRVLRSVVQPPMLSMFNGGYQLPLRGSVAPHLVGDHDPRGKSGPLEQFAKKLLRCRPIAAALHEDINHLTLSIHRSPQVKLLSLDRDQHFV